MTTSIAMPLDGDRRPYIVCYRYPDTPPILVINSGGGSFSLSITGDITDNHLQAVRDLVDAALVFQAEVERLACGAPMAVPS